MLKWPEKKNDVHQCLGAAPDWCVVCHGLHLTLRMLCCVYTGDVC